MKKFYTIIASLVVCFSLCSCGGPMGTLGTSNNSGLSSLSGADAGNIIGNLLSSLTGGMTTNKASIVGTWTYAKPCVQFESQNLLAQAGGSVAAASIENKLASYYQKLGITTGKAQFAFASDGTMQYAIAGRTMTGKYTFNSSNNTLTITTQTGINVTAYVTVSGNQMALTFDASKLLSLVNAAAASSAQLGNLSAIVGNFSGMKLGFTFSK